jgi:hypothetical protein
VAIVLWILLLLTILYPFIQKQVRAYFNKKA